MSLKPFEYVFDCADSPCRSVLLDEWYVGQNVKKKQQRVSVAQMVM